VDQMLLSRYSPPAVVVDKALRILEFRGRIAGLLEHASGEATLNLLKMAPTSFGMEVQKLVRQVELEGSTVKSKVLSLSTRGKLSRVVISASAIHIDGADPQFLVI